jgi:hypothetical protein
MTVVINGTTGITSPSPFVLEGSTSGTVTVAAPAIAGTNTQTLVATTGTLAPVVSGTAKAWNWNGLTTNKEIDFTDIPSWVKRVTVMFSGVSTSGTSLVQVQLGTSGGLKTSGYLGSVGSTTITTGFGTSNNSGAADIRHGLMVLCTFGANLWASATSMAISNAGGVSTSAGSATLSDTLTQVRVTTVSGADNFDAGTINILYE